MELLFLPGLADVVEAEVGERLGGAGRLRPVPGRPVVPRARITLRRAGAPIR